MVIMYRAVGSERQKEGQKEESDKGSAECEKEIERESGKQHRDTGYKHHRGVTRSCFNPTQRERTATPRETNQGATTVTRSLRGVDRCLITEAEPNSLTLLFSRDGRLFFSRIKFFVLYINGITLL